MELDNLRGIAPTVLLLAAPLPPPFGGIATYLERALPYLTSRGYRLLVLQPPGHDRSTTSDSLMTATLRVPWPWQVMKYLSSRPAMIKSLVRWYWTPLYRDPMAAARRLYITAAWMMSAESLARSQKVHIVQAFDYPWEQGAAAVLLARRLRAKSLISLFGEVMPHRGELTQVDSTSTLYARTSRNVICSADRVVSMTQHCQRHVRQIGLDPAMVGIVRFVVGMQPYHPGVDGAKIRQRYASNGEPLLLFVGQVRPRKGPQILIRALPRILAEFPHCKLLIVGPDHGLTAELRQMVADLDLGTSVEFTGPVQDEVLPAYYAACDVFLFPSLTPVECLGLAFVQAMFAARPVVAAQIGAVCEVLRDTVDGYLATPGDASDLAAKVTRLLGMSPEARRAMGFNGRARALELFDESDVLADIDKVYVQLLKS